MPAGSLEMKGWDLIRNIRAGNTDSAPEEQASIWAVLPLGLEQFQPIPPNQ